MSKTLVAYFSATGTTRRLAQSLAELTGADLFEIKPEIPYAKADLNWMDSKSRSSIEMNDASSRPAIAGTPENMDDYDTVFIGFPIWWYVAPTIISTFLESCDFAGKTVIPFATSGGSGVGKTDSILHALRPDANWKPCAVLNRASKDKLAAWVKELGL